MRIKIPFFGRKSINGARVQVQVYSETDIGLRRANNEDRCVSLEGEDSPGFADAVMIVADGMGGQAHGEVASDMAVEGIIRRLADLETNVLTEHDIAGLHVETVQPIGYERDRTAEQGGKFGGYRRER